MEEEKKVSEETKVKMPEANPYSKVKKIDDAETEAFAKGELTKFHREQREKEAEAATEQKDTDASEETAEKSEVKATPIAERPVNAEDRAFNVMTILKNTMILQLINTRKKLYLCVLN